MNNYKRKYINESKILKHEKLLIQQYIATYNANTEITAKNVTQAYCLH